MAVKSGTLAVAPQEPPDKALATSADRQFLLDEDKLVTSVNKLAIPIIAENLFQTMLGIVDMLMVSRLGAVAIAGVGSALQITFLIIAAISALTVGTTVLVARSIGAGHPEEAARVAKQSLMFGVAFGLVLMVVGHAFAHDIVGALGVTADVRLAGGQYLDVVSLMAVSMIVQLLCGGALRGAGDTRTPMVVTGIVNVVNIIVAYTLIFGHFGFPALGVLGSAWGAGAARTTGAIVLIIILLSGRRKLALNARGGWRVDLHLIWRVLRLGLPSMVEQFLMSLGMLMYSIIVIGMGTTIYATQRITFNALSLSFMPGFGFGMAATTMTGQSIGAQRPELAKKATVVAVRMAILWMSTMGVVLVIFGPQIMRLFSNDPEIVSVGTVALRVIALSQPFQALAQVYAGSLRGAGDTRFPMFATGTSVWLIRLPFGWLFGVVLGLGLPGVYISNVLDGAVRGIAMYLRFRAGKWTNLRV